MALLRVNGLNEGSLLRRTLLHIGTFAFGSLAVVALLSFVLVSIARSILPPHTPKGEGSAQKVDDANEDEATTAKPAAPKVTKPKRSQRALAEEESPNREAEK